MALISDIESSSESGNNKLQARPLEGTASAHHPANAAIIEEAVIEASTSQGMSQQSDSEGLSFPEEWAGNEALFEARNDGTNLSDFFPSDSESHEAAVNHPSRPALSRQNSRTSGNPPTLTRQNSMERVVTTRNMMNNFAEAQRVMQQNVASGSTSTSYGTTDGPYQIKVEPISYPTANPQGFDITVNQSNNPNDNSYKWSPDLNRLYVDWHRMVALDVHLTGAKGVYLLRAKYLYKDSYAPVDRCADCKNRPGEDTQSPAHFHVVRFGGNSAQYFDAQPGMRCSQNLIEFADQGSSVTRAAIQFSCRNSCDKTNKHRERVLVLELLCVDTQGLVGSKEFSVRVCASPGRDHANDLEKILKQVKQTRKATVRTEPGDGSSSDEHGPSSSKKVKRPNAGSGKSSKKVPMMSADFVHLYQSHGSIGVPPEDTSEEVDQMIRKVYKWALLKEYIKKSHPDVMKMFDEQVFPYMQPSEEVLERFRNSR